MIGVMAGLDRNTSPPTLRELQCDAQGRLITAAPVGATPTDGSGTIITAGVAQDLFGAATPAHGFSVQNLSSADLWINDLAAPAIGAAGSICIPPGALYETPPGMAPGGAVRIVGAAVGQKFTARSW